MHLLRKYSQRRIKKRYKCTHSYLPFCFYAVIFWQKFNFFIQVIFFSTCEYGLVFFTVGIHNNTIQTHIFTIAHADEQVAQSDKCCSSMRAKYWGVLNTRGQWIGDSFSFSSSINVIYFSVKKSFTRKVAFVFPFLAFKKLWGAFNFSFIQIASELKKHGTFSESIAKEKPYGSGKILSPSTSWK